MTSLQVSLTDKSGSMCKQLVKSGADDMRQDDVIRQFFVMLNHLLQHDRATADRGLGIRSYKVRTRTLLEVSGLLRRMRVADRCDSHEPLVRVGLHLALHHSERFLASSNDFQG